MIVLIKNIRIWDGEGPDIPLMDTMRSWDFVLIFFKFVMWTCLDPMI